MNAMPLLVCFFLSLSTKKMTTTRKAPSASATLFPERTIDRGNDGQLWVVTTTTSKTHRWVPCLHAAIGGVRMLTVDFLARHIGKPVYAFWYDHGDDAMWPKAQRPNMVFIPNGHAYKGRNKKPLVNWLRTQRPAIPDRTVFALSGTLVFLDRHGKPGEPMDSALQVDSKNKQSVSINLLNDTIYVVDKVMQRS